MLDIRYIVGSLIITVAVVAFAISLIVPHDRNTTANATLKPRIPPSKIVEQPAPAPKAAAPKQVAAPATPAPAPAPKQIAAPAKTPATPAPEITGTIAQPKPVPKPAPQRAPVRKKEEAEFQFQWPWLKGWQQD
jgi:hypothetical protein